jgi:hypothetical protein
MAEANQFETRCQSLFATKLGYGRRWKTAAAQGLRIGRATLYRYFADDSAVAVDVVRRLAQLEAGDTKPVRDDRQMVTLFARGLLDVQKQIDDHGWLKDGYPPTLQRSFDLAAARNALDPQPRWPTDFGVLSRLAQLSVYEWGIDVSWDPEGEFAAARLIEGGEITPACIELAMPGKDPEAELTENAGYKLLRSICLDRRDGQSVYAAFRRTVIEHPVLTNWTSTLLADAALAGVERIDEVVNAFYQRIPESMLVDGKIPTCKVSGTVLRRERNGFHTECRDPRAVSLARSGESDPIKWRPGAMQLRRPFRLYWCLPGLTELRLAENLRAAGWTCEMWPTLDRVDIEARSSDGSRRIAIDVKEYLSPENLAARFVGFKEYASTHHCYLVVPDYVPEVTKGFERRFDAVRSAHGKTPMDLRTASDLLEELEVDP